MDLTVTLDRAQVRALLAFCQRHNLDHFFIVRDEEIGALVGAAMPNEHCVTYFPGCDPNLYPDWHAVMVEFFGPEEFVHQLPLVHLAGFLRAMSGRATALRVSATIDDYQTLPIYGDEHAPQL